MQNDAKVRAFYAATNPMVAHSSLLGLEWGTFPPQDVAHSNQSLNGAAVCLIGLLKSIAVLRGTTKVVPLGSSKRWALHLILCCC